MLPIIYSSIVLVPNTAPELALGVSSQRTFYSTVLSSMFHRCPVASSDSVSLLGLRLSTKLMSLWCRCVQCSIFFFFFLNNEIEAGWVRNVLYCVPEAVWRASCVGSSEKESHQIFGSLWWVFAGANKWERLRYLFRVVFFPLDFSWKALGEGKKVWVYPWALENRCVVGVENVRCLRACILISIFIYMQGVPPTP